MKQVVKIFTGYDSYLDNDINEFLKKHPDYTINTITLNTRNEDVLIIALIVFNIKEPTYSKAVGVTRPGETKVIKYEDKKSEYPRCNRCINNLNCFCFGQKDYQGNCEDFQDARDWELTCGRGNNNG